MTIGVVIVLLILLAVSAFCWLIVLGKPTRQIFHSGWLKFSSDDEADKQIRDKMIFATMLIAALATTALLAYVLFLVISL